MRRRQVTDTDEHRRGLLRPPDKTLKQKLISFIWDKEEQTCLTRQPSNWMAITVYYAAFVGVVILVFYISMKIAQAVASMNHDRPQYTLDDSPIGSSPPLNFFPIKSSKNLIWLSKKRSYNEYVDIINDQFEEYREVNEKFNTSQFGECANPPFGYDSKAPCIFFRINRIIMWVPKPYKKEDRLPANMPKEVKDLIRNSDSPKIWLSCNGTTAKDRDHISQDFFKLQGGKGFDVSAFPFDRQSDFVDPIVALKFQDTKPKKILYSFSCTAWSKGLDTNNAKVDEMSAVFSTRKKQRVLSETEKKILKEAFELFDSNNDGYLDYYEFKATSRCLGFHLKKPELLIILETYARCNKNLISYEDFYEVMEEKMAKRDPMDEIREAFKLIANNKTNAITFRDLKHAAEKVGADISDRDLRSMIEEFDTKGEGKLDEEDFISIITGDAF